MEMEHDHKKIYDKIEGWVHRMSMGFEGLTQTLQRIENKSDETLAQAKKTNGRVTKLEDEMSKFISDDYEPFKAQMKKDTELIGFIRRKKWVIGVFVLAFAKVYESIDIPKAIKWITTLFA